MIELKKEFKKSGGNSFKQLFKLDCLAIYEVKMDAVDNLPPSTYYEVFRILVKEKDMYHAEKYEKYPSDEMFGLTAYCCQDASCVGKALYLHFHDHPLTKKLLKYADGTYTRNGENIPYFKISDDDLIQEIAGLLDC